MLKSFKKVCVNVWACYLPALLACGVMLVMASSARATDLLPADPVDIEGFIAEGIVKMGAIVAVAVGGWFVFMMVRKGLKWASRAMG